ncbi:MAG TPA: protein translocase subunit SecD [Bdellovibrionota bacterium]|nr:protein translocase subunit SecD [Bdellovibrionota bacterium]
MSASWKWKSGLLAALVLLSVWILVPTFFPIQDGTWQSKVFKKNLSLNLGLDLRGGTHLVLGIQFEKLLDEQLNRTSEDILKDLQDSGIAGTTGQVDEKTNQITLKAAGPTQTEDIINRINKEWDSLQVAKVEGTTIIVSFTDVYKKRIEERAIDQAIRVISNRVDEFGVAEATITKQGNDRVIVQLPGIKDTERAKELIGKTAKLYFRIVVDREPGELDGWVEKAEAAGIKYDVQTAKYSDFLDSLNEFLKNEIPPDTFSTFGFRVDELTGKQVRDIYLLSKKDVVSGEQLDDAFVQLDQYGRYEVGFQFNPEGGRDFGELTRKYKPTAAKHYRIAVVLDDKVFSAPAIQSEIPGGKGRITLGIAQDPKAEATDLAIVLRAGALPAPMEYLEERTVGPSLGQDSIRQGTTAFIIGSLAVFVFMVLYYSYSGLLANFAVVVNILFILAVLSLFRAALTLPGIAGIILTVGMAVDANVLIYERIREELALGKTARSAIDAGYQRAFSSIVDSNLTTAAAGAILYFFGTGPVKGFAVTLLVGIISSMYTAIVVTHLIYEWFLTKRGIQTIKIG